MCGIDKYINQIIEGDCLDIMRTIPSESVDSIVTDPPYGIDFQSSWRTEKAKRHDKIANDKQPFIWWLYDAYRVLKNDSAMVVFCRWDVQESFKQAIEWAGFKVKSQVIWDRGNHGMGDLEGSFAPQHDVIWFAVKGNFKWHGKRPNSVIQVMRLSGEELVHPNEKPVSLMGHLVDLVTPQGGLTLDMFMGSGATALGAMRFNRRYIGIEREEKYCEIARERLKKADKTSLLFAM